MFKGHIVIYPLNLTIYRLPLKCCGFKETRSDFEGNSCLSVSCVSSEKLQRALLAVVKKTASNIEMLSFVSSTEYESLFPQIVSSSREHCFHRSRKVGPASTCTQSQSLLWGTQSAPSSNCNKTETLTLCRAG